MTIHDNSSSKYEAAVAHLHNLLTPEKVADIGALYTFEFTDGGRAVLDGRSRSGGFRELDAGETPDDANFAVTISRDDFAKLVFGELHPMAGMATGRMKLSGDFRQAIRLDRLLKSE